MTLGSAKRPGTFSGYSSALASPKNTDKSQKLICKLFVKDPSKDDVLHELGLDISCFMVWSRDNDLTSKDCFFKFFLCCLELN